MNTALSCNSSPDGLFRAAEADDLIERSRRELTGFIVNVLKTTSLTRGRLVSATTSIRAANDNGTGDPPPPSSGGAVGRSTPATSAQAHAQAIRMCLLASEQFRSMVFAQVYLEFREAVETGRVPAAHARPILFVIARRVTQRLARMEGRHMADLIRPSPHGEDGPLDVDDFVACSGADAEALVERAQCLRILRRLLAEMPPDDREILLATKTDERYDELAARLQLKEGTARVRAHRLLTKLRERFLAALEGGTATGFDKTE